MSKDPLVLIIDDDRDVAAAARMRLMAGGYRVLLAHDGRDAVRVAVEFRPEAILLDLHMPSLDGLEVLAALGRQAETLYIPVVVFSVDGGKARQALAMRANHFLRKPYRGGDLVAAVHSVIGKNGAETKAPRAASAGPPRCDSGNKCQESWTRIDADHRSETSSETPSDPRPCFARPAQTLEA